MNILFAKSFIDRFHNYESIVVILTIFIVVILTIFITSVSQYLNNTSISVQPPNAWVEVWVVEGAFLRA